MIRNRNAGLALSSTTHKPWAHPDSLSGVPEPKSGWIARPAWLSLTEMNKQLIVLGSTAAWSRTPDKQVTLETSGQNSPNQSSPGTDPKAEGLSPETLTAVRKLLVVPRGQLPAQCLAEAFPRRHPKRQTLLYWPPTATLVPSPQHAPETQSSSSTGPRGTALTARTPPPLLFDAISLSGSLCLDFLELHKAGDLGGRLPILVNPVDPMRGDLLTNMFLPIPVFSTSATKWIFCFQPSSFSCWNGAGWDVKIIS